MWFSRRKRKEAARLAEQHEVTDKYNLVLSNLDVGIEYAKEAREKLRKIQEMIPAQGVKK